MPLTTWHTRDLLSKARLMPEKQSSARDHTRCHDQASRMATPLAAPQQRNKPSFDDLSPELLALIFEQLRDINISTLWAIRCLCRRFDDIATPIVYRTLRLNDNIVAHEAEQQCPHGLSHIYAHTNHIIASSDLNPAGIARILERIRTLTSVRWRYADADFQSGRFWLPSDVLNPQQARMQRTRLYVEDLPLRDFDGDLQNTYVRAIPTDMLVSLKMAPSAPPLTTRLGSLKTLLLSARKLETFHYQDRGQGTQFPFTGTERLPPFRELRLKSYDWRHSRDDVSTHWDFSRIRSLELISVPLFNFLSSVSFSDFANLQTLHVEDFSAHLPEDHRQEATRRLYTLVKHHVRALRTFNATVHTAHFPVDAILTHAGSLRALHLRDHVGFSDEDRRCPTLWADDVALLAARLARCYTLELDLDVAYCPDPPCFLRALCAFPRLHTLTLHVQTVLHPLEVVRPGTDRDREAATRMFDFLVRTKTEAEVPWRRVTINVGGWRKLMVRRLGHPWRRQNARGVFAERCFVLEREAVTGHITIREETAVEIGQSREVPEAEYEY